MSLKISCKVNFYLTEVKKRKNTDKPIRCFVSYNDNRHFVQYVKSKEVQSIAPKFWDKKSKRAKETIEFPEGSHLNIFLDNVEGWIKNEFRTHVINKNAYPTPDEFIKTCRELIENNGTLPQSDQEIKYTGLIEYLNEFIRRCEKGIRQNDEGKPIAENTIKIYRTMLKNITEFEKNGKSLDFNNINLEFYEDYKEFLINNKSYNVNTTGKHLRTLKAVINSAKEDGLTNVNMTGKRYKVHSVDVENIYLNKDELKAIFKLDLSKRPALARAVCYGDVDHLIPGQTDQAIS